MNKRKRNRNLAILLIPDDNTDPISFRISFKKLRILFVLLLIIVIHLLTGLIFYWKYAITNQKNKALNQENITLKEDNKKMYSMSSVIDDLQKYQDRFKAALGINREFEASDRKSSELLSSISPTVDILNEKAFQLDEKPATPKSDFLTQSKSSFHDFAKNVPTFLPVEGFLTTAFREADWFLPHRHLGIDIAAKKGTPVRAAADGIILFANWTNDLGNLIIIDHLNGFLSYYGHNQVLLKKERSKVQKSEVISLLGNSGKSTAPHLHFELWKDGVPIDPREYLISFQNK